MAHSGQKFSTIFLFSLSPHDMFYPVYYTIVLPATVCQQSKLVRRMFYPHTDGQAPPN